LASLSDASASARRVALPALLFALLVAVVYSNPLFFRRNFAGRDLLTYNLPLENAVHAAYARRTLPVWLSEISGGRPLLPNPNAGAFYPLRPILSAVPFPLAARLFPVFHWIAAGVGMIVLLSALGSGPGGAWIGAVTYVFSGVGVSEVFYPHIHPGMALLPWIVWMLARPGLPAVSRTIWLGLLFGLAFLAGDVFTIGLGILAALLWSLVEGEDAGRMRSLAVVAGAVVMACLLAAPQIVATALWVPETSRAVRGLTVGQAFFLSVPPLRLLELLVPYPFGATWSLEDDIWAWPVFNGQSVGLFSTLFAGSFALFALVSLWRKQSPGLRFARWLFVIGLVLSVPPSLAPERWKPLPFPIALRNPEKFAVALTFALAIFAGVAWGAARRSASPHRWTIVVGAVLTALALAALVLPDSTGRLAVALAGAAPDMAARAQKYLPSALAEGGLAWAGLVIALALLRIPGRVPLAGALALLTAGPIVANRRIARVFREEEIFAPTALARIIAKKDPAGEYRTLGESYFLPATRALDLAIRSDPAQLEVSRREWYEYAHALWGRGTVLNLDLDRGDLSRVDTLRKVGLIAVRSPASAAFFGNLSLRFGARYRGQPPIAGYHSFGHDGLQEFDEHASAYPDVRIARKWRTTAGGIPALTEIGRLASGEILIETGAPGGGESAGGRLDVREKRPERLVLDVELSESAWLFVLRAFWTYRTVRIDGREADVVPAQLAFSAVTIPSGRHRVEWVERVPGGNVSRWGPLLFVIATAALLARRRQARRATR
jgi:hypothetical protein